MLSVEALARDAIGKIALVDQETVHLQAEMDKSHQDIELIKGATAHVHECIVMIDLLEKALNDMESHVGEQTEQALKGLVTVETALAGELDRVSAIAKDLDQKFDKVQTESADYEKRLQLELEHRKSELNSLVTSLDRFTNQAESQFATVIHNLLDGLANDVSQVQELVSKHLHTLENAFNELGADVQRQTHAIEVDLNDVVHTALSEIQILKTGLESHFQKATADVDEQFLKGVSHELQAAGDELARLLGDFPHQLNNGVGHFKDTIDKIDHVVQVIAKLVEAIKPVAEAIRAI